jgi:hypothetical protein
MEKHKILVAHERPVIGRAIRRVLAAQGLAAEVVADGHAVGHALELDTWHGLVLDVGLPGPPVHQLVALAKTGVPLPVKALILIASVFRRSSYKRRPQQLYGADACVEVHQLGLQLPSRLWRLLGQDPSGIDGLVESEALLASLQSPGGAADGPALAELLVADAVMASGDKLADAESAEATHAALASELAQVRELWRGVAGPEPAGADPVKAALDELLRPIEGERGGVWT